MNKDCLILSSSILGLCIAIIMLFKKSLKTYADEALLSIENSQLRAQIDAERKYHTDHISRIRCRCSATHVCDAGKD